ncbi:MAG: 3-methyl-2-oxobutanoate hydroxymethyltransferase [Candidatus Omnitrophica bacterium]|nr:3-methyl-2-oxobutanoate hydroxymethyltransferase [Candidatus Omnitrophota bacterium]
MPNFITVQDIINRKNGPKIVMLTAYDYPSAVLADQAGIDVILVGDSLANVVLGLKSTTDVGMPGMIHHAKAVRRAVKTALMAVDMPFDSVSAGIDEALVHCQTMVKETGCDAVKIEWCDGCLDIIRAVTAQNIPVIGHVGLTPQTAEQLGGFKVQGKDALSAKRIIQQAVAMELAGCFCLVLECIPSPLAKILTSKLRIPTIGIGAGHDCDGQVLVMHDILGMFSGFRPKFVKQYANCSAVISQAMTQFKNEVQSGHFPDESNEYQMNDNELKILLKDAEN